MANADLILFIIFGLLCLLALAATVFCLRRALKVSGERDGDLKMFFWAAGALCAVIIAGMSAAYILLPILLHN